MSGVNDQRRRALIELRRIQLSAMETDGRANYFSGEDGLTGAVVEEHGQRIAILGVGESALIEVTNARGDVVRVMIGSHVLRFLGNATRHVEDRRPKP